jgi:hypothetical protein
MGQHKSNPTAQLAKEGKIPPKPRPMSKAELDMIMRLRIRGLLKEKTGIDPLNPCNLIGRGYTP